MQYVSASCLYMPQPEKYMRFSVSKKRARERSSLFVYLFIVELYLWSKSLRTNHEQGMVENQIDSHSVV